MTFQQALSLSCAIFDGIGAGQAEGIKAVQVTTCGQDLRRAQQIATGCGTYIATIERGQQAIQFMRLMHELTRCRQLGQ